MDLKQLGIQSLVQSEKKKAGRASFEDAIVFKIVFVFEWDQGAAAVRERNSKECRNAVVAQRTMSQLSFHCRLPKDHAKRH